MRTLTVSISDNEFNKFGLPENNLRFSELIQLIRKELMRENLEASIALAEKYGLSNMTMDEISEEVNAVRQNAKANR